MKALRTFLCFMTWCEYQHHCEGITTLIYRATAWIRGTDRGSDAPNADDNYLPWRPDTGPYLHTGCLIYGSLGSLGQRTCITSRENIGFIYLPRVYITLKAQFELHSPWRRANMVPEVAWHQYCSKQSSVPYTWVLKPQDRHAHKFTLPLWKAGMRMEISSCSSPHKIHKVTLHAEFSRQLIKTTAGEPDPDWAWQDYSSLLLILIHPEKWTENTLHFSCLNMFFKNVMKH